MHARKRVLVIDDSALVRGVLSQLINADPRLEVVATARDPIEAWSLIQSLQPDLLTLDVEMPRLDGLTFLRDLMRQHPLPVVMISTFTAAGAPATLDALALGAVDFVEKPRLSGDLTLAQYGQRVTDKLAAAAGARPRAGTVNPSLIQSSNAVLSGNFVLALGASTGGTEAIRVVLQGLPAQCPPVLIVQHLPPAFASSFAKRLDSVCPMRVVEAEHGQAVCQGEAYVAPGHSHLLLCRRANGWCLELSGAAPVNGHRPSVEVLFDSVAVAAGARAAAALLTGMGSDGAAALGRLRAAGAATYAQDEASSVIWGMPGAASRGGACEAVLPLERIAPALARAAAKGRAGALANGP